MPLLKNGEALGQLMESAINQGLNAEYVRARFVQDNSKNGQFNADETSDFAIPFDRLASFYGNNPGAKSSNMGPAGNGPADGSLGGSSVSTSVSTSPTRSRTTTSTKDIPEGALSAFMDASGAYQKRSNEIIPLMQGITGDTVKAGNDAKTALDAEAGAKSAVITAQGETQKAQIGAKNNILAALGLNLDDPSSIMNQELGDMVKAQQITRNLKPQIDAARNVSLLEDPVGWIQSQYKLEGMSKQYNAAAATFNNGARVIGSLQQAAAAQQALTPGVTAALVDQDTKARADYELSAAQVKKFQIDKDQRVAQMASFSTELQAMGVVTQNAAQLMRIVAERTSISETEDKKDKEAIQLGRVNMYVQSAGGLPYTPEQFKALRPQSKEALIKLGNSGKMAFGATPGEALNTLGDAQLFGSFTDGLRNSFGKSWLEKYAYESGQAADALRLAQPKLSEDEAFKKAADTKYKQWRDEAAKREYDKLSPDNPYRMNAAVWASAFKPGVNSIADYVRATPNSGAGLRIQDVMSWAAQQVATGKPLEQVTKELGDFSTTGNRFQQDQYGLSMLGFDLRNTKSNNIEYPVDGTMLQWFGGKLDPRNLGKTTSNVNLYNPSSIQNWLVWNAAQMKASKAAMTTDSVFRTTGGPTGGPGRMDSLQGAEQ